MSTSSEIAQEVNNYLQQGTLTRDEFEARHAPELEQAGRQAQAMAREGPPAAPGTRGIGETAAGMAGSAGGVAGWVWKQVEPVVKRQICAPATYQQLQAITVEQLVGHVNDILEPLAASVTQQLPAGLRFLVPLLGVLRKLLANIIASELQRAARQGWAQYCGLPANG